MWRLLWLPASTILIICFSVLCNNHSQHKSHRDSSKSHNIRNRCRTVEDLGRIPWQLPNSTFHNFGYPLLKTLCELNIYSPGSSINLKGKKESKLVNCSSIKSRQYDWLYTSYNSTRAGGKSSTILIDPPLIDDGGASAGVFTINALFPILYELGYKVRIRNWSPSFNSSFPEDIVAAAMSDSTRWTSYVASMEARAMIPHPNPFSDVEDYITLQVESGVNLYQVPQPYITGVSSSEFPRTLRWIIGYQKRASDIMYDVKSSSKLNHCIGANFFLGEGFRCSSSSLIMCPMFPLHQQKSLLLPQIKDQRFAMKKNIVLIDGDNKDISQTELLKALQNKGLSDVKVLVHANRKRSEIPNLYQQVKVTVDCRNPGVEFINYESSLYDAINLVCDSRATRSVFDFPVPSRYRYEPTMMNETYDLIYQMLVNYTEHVENFRFFKALSNMSSSVLVPKQLDLHLFSRDVLFRSHCRTFSECRRVIPWALSVWALFPLARIEVYIDISYDEFVLDNDVIFEIMSHTFISMYWKVYVWNHFKAANDRFSIPANLPPTVPCSHVMYMSPNTIIFGRDFLNEHIAAIEEDKEHRPITVFSKTGELLVAFSKVYNRRPDVYHWSDWNDSNKEWMYKAYLIINDTRYEIDDVALSSIGYNGLDGTAKVKKSVIDKMPSGLPDGVVLTYNSSDSIMSLAPLPLKKFTHPALPLDFLYIVKAPENSRCQIWVSSTSEPIKCSTVLNRHRSDEDLLIIVTHLDPVVQSSFFQKVMRFLPNDIQKVLMSFDAMLYPEVISFFDSKSQSWGEECVK